MTKYLIAFVKDKYGDKSLDFIRRSNYSSKSAFKSDLRANGYAVRWIMTGDEYDDWMEFIGQGGYRNYGEALRAFHRQQRLKKNDSKILEWA